MPRCRVHGERLALQQVAQHDLVSLQVGPVVGVLVAEDDGVDVGQRDVPLEVGEGSRTGVDPDGRAAVLDEVAAARPARPGE